ncbi:MAG: NAD(P)/FAD-dependent oxidoreductase [Methylacidiphilales bacterium]|nr:NAD(P)/FAD-dependent oxidoreductase [Candidatus Methylacidiphilales bacterium]
MKKYDAIVVGAGPAGSLFSYLTAKAGLHTLLIDKAVFPRSKVCGDCLNPRCWNIWERQGLADSFRTLPHSVIKSFSLSFENNPPSRFPLPDGIGELRAVTREVLDEWLRQQAIEAGAECLTGIRGQSIDYSQRLMTDAGEFQGKVLIGADGRTSWVARMGGFPSMAFKCRRIAWQTTLPGDATDESIHMKFFREGYFGLVRYSPQYANLCMTLSGRRTGATPQKIMNRLFPGHEHLTWHSTYPISRQPRVPARDNILLLGDAARVVEPFTGEGIYLALRTAEIAAQLVIDTYRKGGWSTLDRHYIQEHARLYQGMSFHNNLTRFLGKHPRTGMLTAKSLTQVPTVFRALASSFFKKQ